MDEIEKLVRRALAAYASKRTEILARVREAGGVDAVEEVEECFRDLRDSLWEMGDRKLKDNSDRVQDLIRQAEAVAGEIAGIVEKVKKTNAIIGLVGQFFSLLGRIIVVAT